MSLLDAVFSSGFLADGSAVMETIVENTEVEFKAVLPTQIEVPLDQTISNFLRYGYTEAHSPSAAMALYDKSSFVSIPINKISKPFSCLDPIMYDRVDQVVMREHPVLSLLRKPAPLWSQELFFKALANNYLITGDCVIVATGGPTRPPLELVPISPKEISVVEGQDGFPHHVQVAGNYFNGQYFAEIKQNEIRYTDGEFRELHLIREYATDRGSRMRGQSVLKSASRDVTQAILGTEHNVSMLEKGGRISLIFHYDEDFDDEDYELTKKRVMDQYGGASKAGQVGVTSGGKLDIKETGVSNKDMDYRNLHEQIKMTLALLYDVPLPLVSLDASTMNNYEIAIRALYDDAVIPLAKVLLNGLGEFILPRYKMDPARYAITFDQNQITALRMRTLEELKVRSDINIESDNELRVFISREGYSGGHRILKASGLIPVGEDLMDDNGDLIDDDSDLIEDEDVLSTTSEDPDLEDPESTINASSDEVNPASDSLNGAQIKAMVDLVTAVATGDLTINTASRIMVKAFGVSMEEALDIIGDPTILPEPEPESVPGFGGEEEEEEGDEEDE